MIRYDFRFVVLVVWLLVALTGCNTQPVKQSKAFAEAGIAYSVAIDELMKTTIEVVVEQDSRTLLYLQSLTSMADKKAERAKLAGYLSDHDAAIKKQLIALNELHKNSRLLKRYFVSLNALATATESNAASQSVGKLSDAINTSNTKLKKNEKLAISDTEKQALTGVSAFVASTFQSAQLRSAMKRDAQIISEQLLLNEKMLALLSNMILHAGRANAARDYKSKVMRPYKNKKISKTATWKNYRKDILLFSSYDATLERAKESAEQMRSIWHSMVENKLDITSIELFIQDVNDIVTVAAQVKAALKDKE
jgi:hypothetical protein